MAAAETIERCSDLPWMSSGLLARHRRSLRLPTERQRPETEIFCEGSDVCSGKLKLGQFRMLVSRQRLAASSE